MQRRDWLRLYLSLGISTSVGISRLALSRENGNLVVTEGMIDAKRLNRRIPIKVRWPAASFGSNRPLVIFSHGLGGTMNGGERYGEAWTNAGMITLHIQHTGSDLAALRASLPAAMAPEQLINRAEDVRAVLDYVEESSSQSGDEAWKRVDLSRVGLGGHSFGSRTVMAVAGEKFPNPPASLNLSDPRPKAFIALSPFSSGGDLDAMRRNLRDIVRPTLTITGTEDGDVVNVGTTPAQRAAVYEALPSGNKAGLILKDADHFTFAGQDLPAFLGRRQRLEIVMLRQKEHLTQLAQLTTDWWLAHLTQDPAAVKRLVEPTIRPDRGDIWLRG